MLFLSADVHHMSMRTGDQRFLQSSEASLAAKYLSISARYEVKVTVFITGRAIAEEEKEVRKLLDFEGVEFGGHTWSCFKPALLHKALHRLGGPYCGPAFYQRRDVRRTVRAIRALTGGPCRSWRGHGHGFDKNTRPILRGEGVGVLSTGLDPEGVPSAGDDVTDAPLNIIPDHSRIPHGLVGLDRAPDRPGMGMCTPSEWLKVVQSAIAERIGTVGYASLLMHPSCMEIIDGMRTFEAMCRHIAERGYRTALFRDLAEMPVPPGK